MRTKCIDLADIRAVRAALGKSQRQAAQLLGLSIRAVQSYEQGWRPVPPTVQRLAGVLLMTVRRHGRPAGTPCWKVNDCPPRRPGRVLRLPEPRRGTMLGHDGHAVRRERPWPVGEQDPPLHGLHRHVALAARLRSLGGGGDRRRQGSNLTAWPSTKLLATAAAFSRVETSG